MNSHPSGNSGSGASKIRSAEKPAPDNWNPMDPDCPLETAIPELFLEVARRVPDSTAFDYQGVLLSYGTLTHAAMILAHQLRAAGVMPETRVGIGMSAGPDWVIATLAVVLAGGVYVPLDPDYPSARLNFMIADTDMRLILVDAAARPVFETGELPLITVDGRLPAHHSVPIPEPPPHETGPDHLTYIMYTSGSTGIPKGTTIPQRAVVRLVRNSNYVNFGPKLRIGQAANVAFDATTFELWGALLNGGCMVGVPKDTALNPSDLAGHLKRTRVNTQFLTVALFNRIAAEQPDAFSDLDTLMVGGEAVDPEAMRRVLEHGAPGCLQNIYGPTENTTFSTFFPVGEIAENASHLPIGLPITNTYLRVLDETGRPLGLNEDGELCTGGVGLARGYHNRPELTAERFIPDPQAIEPGARLYRSGDLVRGLPSGDIQFLNRIDHQVKLRGFRVEPGEIQAALARHPAVSECLVVVRQARDKFLAAYFVPIKETQEGTAIPGTDGLIRFLRESLPDYMIPRVFVPLERFPLTANGKIDKAALPDPKGVRPALDTAYVAPRNDLEQSLATIWQEVLELDRVGVHDAFLALGGHSLLAARVVSRMRDRLSMDLRLADLLAGGTIAGLTEVQRSLSPQQTAPIQHADRDKPLPLSFPQKSLYVIDKLYPHNHAYNLAFDLNLLGSINAFALAETAVALTARHEIFRTTYHVEKGEPVQVIHRHAPTKTPVVDLSGLSRETGAQTADAIKAAVARHSYNLAELPPARFILLRLGLHHHHLLLGMHHIASDGWSMGVLYDEIGRHYRSKTLDSRVDMPGLAFQYADFARWQHDRLTDSRRAELVSFWRETLADAPPLLTMPNANTRPAKPRFRGCHYRFTLNGLHSIDTACGRLAVTRFTYLLTAFQCLLHRYSGQDDICVGTPVAGRDRSEWEPLIGFFVNTLVLRSEADPHEPFNEMAHRSHRRVLQAFDHQELPFDLLVQALQPERVQGANPLFQAAFILQSAPMTPPRLPGVTVLAETIENHAAQFDFTMELEARDDDLIGCLEYDTDLFDEAVIIRLADHYKRLVEGLSADAARPMGAYDLMDESERAHNLRRWNRSDETPITPVSITTLFETQARESADAIALAMGADQQETCLSYTLINAHANHLAGRLREAGVGADDTVALFLPRAPELIISMLAVLKAGAAYVPVDPTYPADRIAFMLNDGGMRAVMTLARLGSSLPKHEAALLKVDTLLAETPLKSSNPFDPCGPDHLSHVIYTSGSTGTPKGVQITRGAVTTLLHWMNETFPIEHRACMLAATSVSFDLSVYEILGTLCWGQTIVLAENALQLPRLVGRDRVTMINTVPSAMAELVRAGAVPTGVRAINLAGEPLGADLAARILQLPHVESLYNLYGPSEDTTYSTYAAMKTDQPPNIGVPVSGTCAYIVDALLNPVPEGVSGELLLGGRGLARGYRERPILTAERFIPNPFAAESGAGLGARLYRTGDLVRGLPDGSLDFLGRTDHQVKLRGFRIELGEIEAALEKHESVERALVMVRRDGTEDARLVAYVASLADAGQLIDACRQQLSRQLPAYMVPSAFVILEAFPLTPNGKINRKALPAPSGDQQTLQGEHSLEPRTPLEAELAAIWRDVLGLARVGVEDDFFKLGGHSLLAMRVLGQVRDVTGVDLSPQMLFEAPTIAELAHAIEADGGDEEHPILSAPRQGDLPISFAQQQLWLLTQMDDGNVAYNLPFPLDLNGPLDVSALCASLNDLTNRHEAPRTAFSQIEPLQRVADKAELPCPLIDLSRLPLDRAERIAERIALAQARVPFNLTNPPLARTHLLRLTRVSHRLLFTIHHIIADGWSARVWFDDLSILYNQRLLGESESFAGLARLSTRAVDYAYHQRHTAGAPNVAKGLTYWRQQLHGLPALLELPLDHPRGALQTYRGGQRYFHIDDNLHNRLSAVGRREGATAFMTYYAALTVLLARYSRQDDFAVGTIIANRDRTEFADVIGFLVETLVLRTDASADPRFTQLLQRARKVTLSAYANRHVPFGQVLEAVRPKGGSGGGPLFQVLFLMQPEAPESPPFAGLQSKRLPFSNGTAKFDLTLSLDLTSRGLRGTWEFNSDLFEPTTINGLTAHFKTLLRGIAAEPERSIHELPLLDQDERTRVLHTWNHTGRDFEPVLSIHEWVAARAHLRPDAIALTMDNGMGAPMHLSYNDLETRAGSLAATMRALGVRPGHFVGVCTWRSLELVVGLLAVLKTGAAYVPLDPEYPTERLDLMTTDAACPLVLCTPASEVNLPAQQLRLDISPETPAYQSEPWQHTDLSPDHAMYLIYTSGSTGRPKGVVNSHRGLHNRLQWIQTRFPADARDRLIQKTPFSFDVSVWEFFWPLVTGGCLIIALPNGHQDPTYLAGMMTRQCLSLMHFVPSMLRAFLEERPRSRYLRMVICSGEALPLDLCQTFAGHFGKDIALVNLYGPTEAAVEVSYWRYDRSETIGGIPIGKPTANTRLYVLDGRLQPTPIGVPGELYIGGVQVAQGYLGRPDLSAAYFGPDPFAEEPGMRLYRTGDLARRRVDGNILYMGRIDFQVKLRGFRIELGEIEKALTDQEAVREAAVLVREDRPGDQRLTAYIIWSNPQDPPALDGLRKALASHLPGHMVPTVYVPLEAMPLTVSGKLNRRALPEPIHESDQTYQPPQTETEKKLAAIWSEVLGVDRVSRDDQFFHLGGHSLLASRVASQVRDQLGVKPAIRDLFAYPVLHDLAARLDAADHAPTETGLRPMPRKAMVINDKMRETAPLSFQQERLWFLDRFSPGFIAYNVPILFEVNGPLDEAALQKALNQLADRHLILHTRYVMVDDAPLQFISMESEIPLEVSDLHHQLADEVEGVAAHLIEAAVHRPFALDKSGPCRVTLVKLNASRALLLIDIHHIAFDLWSADLFMSELNTFYEAALKGAPAGLEPLPLQYADYAAWQRERLQGKTVERALTYWKERLGGNRAPLDLPTDKPRPRHQTYTGAVHHFEPAPNNRTRVAALAGKHQATPFMVLLAVFKTLLHRYTGQSELIVGGPVTNRGDSDTERLIGFFVNTLAFRSDFSEVHDFNDLLAQVRETALGAYAHAELPFEMLVDLLEPRRDLSRPPIFQVMFVHQTDQGKRRALGEAELIERDVENGTAKFDLTLYVRELEGRVSAGIEYNSGLFEQGTIARMAGHFSTVLETVLTRPATPLKAISLASETERGELIALADGGRVLPLESLLHRHFERNIPRNQDAAAIRERDVTLSFVEVERRANRLARHLRSLGVGPDQPVLITVPRSPELLVSVLGALKAGGAYTPIEPGYPNTRKQLIQEDTGATVRITRSDILDQQPAFSGETLLIDCMEAVLSNYPDTPPELILHPENLSYILYTSGSTGKPKGVAMSHACPANLMSWMHGNTTVKGPVSTLQFTSLNFDVSTQELFFTWSTGGCVVLVSEAVRRDPSALFRYLSETGVVRLCLPFVALQHLAQVAADASLPVPASLREILTAGEQPRTTPKILAFMNELDRCRLHNQYGPTETHVCTDLTLPVDHALWDMAPPIGRPVANARAIVLDRGLQPVPFGVHGELYIGGVAPARGYLGRPDLTAARFIPDPYSNEPGARMYESGDVCSFRANGDIAFHGRADFQVKIRGYRIELEEVEACLAQHPDVKGVIVLAPENRNHEKVLAAYVVPCDEGILKDVPAATAALKQFAAERLPDYMVPTAVMYLKEFPLTSNGKLDRRALPEPEVVRPNKTYVAPSSGIERRLSEIWKEVLGLDRVGIQDNFFDLGGHSLTVARVHGKLQKVLGRSCPMVKLFEYPTIAAFAAFLDREGNQPEATDESVKNRADSRREALQRRRRTRK